MKIYEYNSDICIVRILLPTLLLQVLRCRQFCYMPPGRVVNAELLPLCLPRHEHCALIL